MRRVGAAVSAARTSGSLTIDVVQAVARFVPVTLGHRYLGVPVAPELGTFELTPDMLRYYGTAIPAPDGTTLPQTVTLPDGTSVLVAGHGAGEGRRRHSGRAPDVPMDQGRLPALLQQRAEGSAGAGPGSARVPSAAGVPAARDRHPASAPAGRPARGRHDADAALAVSDGPFRADRGRGRPIWIPAWSAIFASRRT